MGWPQIIYLMLISAGLGIELSQHGKPKMGYHNAFINFTATALVLWLLYEGGFFK